MTGAVSLNGFIVGEKVKVIDTYNRPDLDKTAVYTIQAITENCVQLEGNDSAFTANERLVRYTEPSIKSSTQLGKVLALTLGQGSWTLAGIASVTGASEAAVSARLRDLRAAGYEVTCVKHRGDAQRSYTVRNKVITVGSDAVATVG